MNERKNHISPKWIRNSALLLVIFTLPVIAADESGYALLLQSSPADGGKIIPGNGVFKVAIGQSIPLIAVPQKGYRFLYWLGDVGQTDMMRTTIRMDSPKLIVAVFEREEFEDLQPAILEASGTATGGTYNSNPLDRQGGMMDSRRIIEPRPTPTPEEPESDDFPVPDEGSDPFPVPDEKPVPEPVTILLFATGSVLMMRMRRK